MYEVFWEDAWMHLVKKDFIHVNIANTHILWLWQVSTGFSQPVVNAKDLSNLVSLWGKLTFNQAWFLTHLLCKVFHPCSKHNRRWRQVKQYESGLLLYFLFQQARHSTRCTLCLSYFRTTEVRVCIVHCQCLLSAFFTLCDTDNTAHQVLWPTSAMHTSHATTAKVTPRTVFVYRFCLVLLQSMRNDLSREPHHGLQLFSNCIWSSPYICYQRWICHQCGSATSGGSATSCSPSRETNRVCSPLDPIFSPFSFSSVFSWKIFTRKKPVSFTKAGTALYKGRVIALYQPAECTIHFLYGKTLISISTLDFFF